MKTLDEVITAMENLTTCDDTGFSYIAHDDVVDAVHYLVEYRACQQHMEVVEQIRQDAVRQRDAHIKALGELNRNEPLTCEDLRQMKGKPVWIEEYWAPLDGEVDSEKYWAIIAYENERRIGVQSAKIRQGLLFETMGDVGNGTYRWQAFRKERA